MKLYCGMCAASKCCMEAAQFLQFVCKYPKSIFFVFEENLNKLANLHIDEFNSATFNAFNQPNLPILVDGEEVYKGAHPILTYFSSFIPPTDPEKSQTFLEAEVSQWLFMATKSNFFIEQEPHLHTINDALNTQTTLVGQSVTMADIAIFNSVSDMMMSANDKKKQNFTNIKRWFDYLAKLSPFSSMDHFKAYSEKIQETAPDFAKQCNTQPNETNKDTKNGPNTHTDDPNTHTNPSEHPTHTHTHTSDEMCNKQADKQAKKEAKKMKNEQREVRKEANKLAKGPPKKLNDERPIEDPTRLDLRVGIIKEVREHPDADKCFVEQIDIGEDKPREIVSGLKGFITAENLVNSVCVIVSNMKPKKVRGIESHGMVLCATSQDHSKVELLQPPEGTPIGERIVWQNITMNEPDAVLSVKEGKNPFVAVQPGFKTNQQCEAFFKDNQFMSSKGPVKCQTITDGSIS